MNENELIRALKNETGLSEEQASEFLKAFAATIIKSLRSKESVKISGFGVFKVKNRPSREMRNPSTGKMMMSKATRGVTFKPDKGLIASMGGPHGTGGGDDE